MIDFTGKTCQEHVTGSLLCGQAADSIIYHKKDNRSYFMCPACAYHNSKNRGGVLQATEGKLIPGTGELVWRPLDAFGFLDELLNDTMAPGISSDDQLANIAQLAELQLAQQAVVAALTLQLSEATEKLRNLSEKALPDAMAAVGMAEFKLMDGSKVIVKDEVAASIRSGLETYAASWLDEQGLGDVVKDTVTVPLGRGESAFAKQFLDLAEQLGLTATEKQGVHASTLKALVKEQLAQGREFPEEYFSIYQYRKATIKPAKGK